jgi:hypothetical protein
MPRHQSLSDFDPMRPHSAANLQGFYANQRFQGRGNEPEGMAQAKRRMAAQRERELRNYHQEQQINRSRSFAATPFSCSYLPAYNAERGAAGTRAEGTSSPSGLNEEERRTLIAQQRNALYAGERVPGASDNQTPRPLAGAHNAPASTAGATRGASPRAYDPFHMSQSQTPGVPLDQSGPGAPQQAGTGPAPSMPPQRSRANSTSSPSSNPNSFSLFDNAAQQSSRTSTSSPGGSSPTSKAPQSATAGVAPIGTRPAQAPPGPAPNPALNKRSTTPLPSPLAYGFTSNEDGERSASASSNPPATHNQDVNVGLGWGSKSGVWGSNKPLGVQASVWG